MLIAHCGEIVMSLFKRKTIRAMKLRAMSHAFDETWSFLRLMAIGSDFKTVSIF